jgi:hypothetical protein
LKYDLCNLNKYDTGRYITNNAGVNKMKYSELNKLLVENFPDLKEKYIEKNESK